MTSLPDNIERCRKRVASLLECLRLRRPLNSADRMALFLGSRTNGGRALPDYFLVYFLLVDLLEFPNFGQDEKVAWSVPVQYEGRIYVVEHRKMGLGIFEPQLDTTKHISGPTTEQGERDSVEICTLIQKACDLAGPYFEWRAQLQAKGSDLNVVNHSSWLFERYTFFCTEAYRAAEEGETQRERRDYTNAWYASRHAEWFAQSAIEAFFSWTEHAFIHLAILQGKLVTGEQVRVVAAADWRAKFKAAIDVSEGTAKAHYDRLLDLRIQIRNFLAHGSFGKRGEAFSFHSGAGAVPLLISESRKSPFHMAGRPATHDFRALSQIQEFIDWLWSTRLAAAKLHLDSTMPSILTYAADGTYASAMRDEDSMKEFVTQLEKRWDDAANMDW